jgi:hypothetical protein
MLRSTVLTIFTIILSHSFVSAQEFSVVTLGALNKITAKLETIDVSENETVKFGTLEITMRTCQSNPPEETPESVAFLEVTDLGHIGSPQEVFKGWMFASSPAISALEHAVYDVWVTDCKTVDPSASSDNL